MPLLPTALAAILAVGTLASPGLEAHPSSPSQAARIYDALSMNLRGWSASSAELGAGPNIGLSAGETRAPGRAASATSPLDLHKLTMSDFGDVEQSR